MAASAGRRAIASTAVMRRAAALCRATSGTLHMLAQPPAAAQSSTWAADVLVAPTGRAPTLQLNLSTSWRDRADDEPRWQSASPGVTAETFPSESPPRLAAAVASDAAVSNAELLLPQRCHLSVEWLDDEVAPAASSAPVTARRVNVVAAGKIEGDVSILLGGAGQSAASVTLDKVRGDAISVDIAGTGDAAPEEQAAVSALRVTDVVEARDARLLADSVRVKRLLAERAVVETVGNAATGGVAIQGAYVQQLAVRSYAAHRNGVRQALLPSDLVGAPGGDVRVDTIHGSAVMLQLPKPLDAAASGDAATSAGADWSWGIAPTMTTALTGSGCFANVCSGGGVDLHVDSLRGDTVIIADGDIRLTVAPPAAIDLILVAARSVVVIPGLRGLFRERAGPAGMAGAAAGGTPTAHALAALRQALYAPAFATTGLLTAEARWLSSHSALRWGGDGDAMHMPWTVFGRLAVHDEAMPQSRTPEQTLNDPTFRPHEMDAALPPAAARGAAASVPAPRATSGKISMSTPVTGFYDGGKGAAPAPMAHARAGASPLEALKRAMAPETPVHTLICWSARGCIDLQVRTWLERLQRT